MSMASKFKGAKKKARSIDDPLWKGPYVDGITQSMLSAFIVDRMRFYVKYILGLGLPDQFDHKIGYGDMWHLCEETHKAGKEWEVELHKFANVLCRRYPMQQDLIAHWCNVCKRQFPIYLKFYEGQTNAYKSITHLYQEEVFAVDYKLPSGRTVILRGKFDGIDLIERKNGKKELYLWENKTKGDIDEGRLRQQLTFDLQTMLYLIAMAYPPYGNSKYPKTGVIYNVIRRPLSGGKGTIRKHQPSKSNPQGESDAEFYARVAEYIENEPTYYFMRWDVIVTQRDYELFRNTFLNPCLEALCQWWEFITVEANTRDQEDRAFSQNYYHYRTPYGIYNILAEGGSTEYDEFLANGSEVGLERIETLFPELQSDADTKQVNATGRGKVKAK